MSDSASPGEEEATARQERLRMLEDWCAAEGIELGSHDRWLLEMTARSPGAFAEWEAKVREAGQ